MTIRRLFLTLMLTCAVAVAAQAGTVLGTGNGALLGGDLTDPENDGTSTGANYNADFASTNEPGFGGGEFSFNVFSNTLGGGSSKWCCTGPPATGFQLDAKLHAGPHVLTHFTIASSNDSPDRDPRVWSIQGSNDGKNWTPIHTRNDPATNDFTARDQVIRYDAGADFATPESFQYFRYDVQKTGNNDHALGELEYFGTAVPRIEVGGDNAIGTLDLDGQQQNVATGPLTGGKTVQIVNNRNDTIQISEVQAFETGTGINKALQSEGGLATASSYGWGGVPTRANDGDTAQGSNTWWHSADTLGATLTVTLAVPTALDSVHVYGRNDCCQDRQNDFNLVIKNEGGLTLFDQQVTGLGTGPGANANIPVEMVLSGEVKATLDGAITYAFEIQDAATADQLTVGNPLPGVLTTVLDVNGASIEVELAQPLAAGWYSWKLLDADAIEGDLGELILPQYGDHAWDTSRLLEDGTLSLVVPEPCTVLAVLGGLAGLGGYVRRRRRQA